MKSVLISIQPKWCELIASGKKTIEVRKTRPKIDTPFKVYIYMTKDKWYKDYKNKCHYGNGKVIGEFVCDEIRWANGINFLVKEDAEATLKGSCLTKDDIYKYLGVKSGMSRYDKKTEFYRWHISDLVIYDKPKELSEFFKVGHCEYCKSEWEERERFRIQLDKHNEITGDKAHLNTDSDFKKILKLLSPFKMKRPPQSWCYVEGKEDEGK